MITTATPLAQCGLADTTLIFLIAGYISQNPTYFLRVSDPS